MFGETIRTRICRGMLPWIRLVTEAGLVWVDREGTSEYLRLAGESLIEHEYFLVNTRLPVEHLLWLYTYQDTSVDSSNSSLSAASSVPTHSGCPQGQGSRGVCFESPHTALQNWSSISTRHRQDS